MRIVVTGGAGLVGTPICERFLRNGWDVHVIDTAPDPGIAGVSYAQCDILDFAALSKQVEGCDAIAHLAAIPSTLTHPNSTLFNVNVAGTYNVFEAAERAGVRRIAQASSINAFGGYWGCDDRQYDYFPAGRGSSPAYHRRLFFFQADGRGDRRLFPPALRHRQRFISLPRRLERRGHRSARTSPKPQRTARASRRLPPAPAERGNVPAWPTLAPGRWSGALAAFRNTTQVQTSTAMRWMTGSCAPTSSIASITGLSSTPDDSTQAFEKALTADFQGAHALFVNSDLNFLNYDAEALLAIFFPEVSRRSKALRGAEALVNIERARQLIGFEPAVHSVI